jgi:hypothetical protein
LRSVPLGVPWLINEVKRLRDNDEDLLQQLSYVATANAPVVRQLKAVAD